ncbi:MULTISPECIES: DNA polymerase IV [Dermacoccus]|uniref:DNA polymerase IV n=2 Tax=Dermacoccus TaxID=57495 RepID=A0A417ZA14_9MICO|nr:DNA polymerase IV [Dermacoccus abyssi]RHW47493.1 DNA polymerase IV [Dermacoccus abyssi]
MRSDPSILHVDLDAFFASVEQRDKPSLRGRPVVVGGTGMRGVVSTASYEARVYGARSAMSTAEARAICPAGTAFLSPRFEAYRKSSLVVMDLLRELSPLVEQVSIDEAYVDLRGADLEDLEVDTVRKRLERLDADIREATGGLTASAGAATSKMLAKIGSDLDKPNGITIVAPGEEKSVLEPMSVRAISGVGPATAARLRTFGVETVGDLRRMTDTDLVSVFGERHGRSLFALARARDDRELTLSREAKSISNEETFERDVHERHVLHREIERIAESVGARAEKAGVFGRTVHLKVRLPDFTALTRSFTTTSPTRDADVIARTATRLLDGLDLPQGVRLLGVGLSGFVAHAQTGLFDLETSADDETEYPEVFAPSPQDEPAHGSDAIDLSTRFSPSPERRWRTGMDVHHPDHGNGWVWGSGRSRVTVRFEGPTTPPGPVHTFAVDDEALSPAEAPSWT